MLYAIYALLIVSNAFVPTVNVYCTPSHDSVIIELSSFPTALSVTRSASLLIVSPLYDALKLVSAKAGIENTADNDKIISIESISEIALVVLIIDVLL